MEEEIKSNEVKPPPIEVVEGDKPPEIPPPVEETPGTDKAEEKPDDTPLGDIPQAEDLGIYIGLDVKDIKADDKLVEEAKLDDKPIEVTPPPTETTPPPVEETPPPPTETSPSPVEETPPPRSIEVTVKPHGFGEEEIVHVFTG